MGIIFTIFYWNFKSSAFFPKLCASYNTIFLNEISLRAVTIIQKYSRLLLSQIVFTNLIFRASCNIYIFYLWSRFRCKFNPNTFFIRNKNWLVQFKWNPKQKRWPTFIWYRPRIVSRRNMIDIYRCVLVLVQKDFLYLINDKPNYCNKN